MITIDRESRKAVLTLKSLDKITSRALEIGGYQAGKQLVKSTSHEILQGKKTGRVYVRSDRSGRMRRHQASAAGETHANMTGKLRRSLSFKPSSKDLTFGYMKNAPEYAAYVEFGTSRMAHRPSLQNGMRRETKNLENIYEKAIIDALL